MNYIVYIFSIYLILFTSQTSALTCSQVKNEIEKNVEPLYENADNLLYGENNLKLGAHYCGVVADRILELEKHSPYSCTKAKKYFADFWEWFAYVEMDVVECE